MAAGAEELAAFKDAMVYLAAAGVAVPLLRRVRVNPVLGFMLAGFAVGPHGLGALAATYDWLAYVTITDAREISGLGALGIIFLLFAIGLELSLERLWALRRLVFGLGGLQVGLTAAALTLLLMQTGLRFEASLVAGLAAALSSTAVSMQLLVSQHRFATPAGQTSFAILLMQDLMVVPILFLAGILGAASAPVAQFGDVLVYGLAAIVGIVVITRWAAVPLMRSAARAGSHELLVALTLLVVMGAAAASGVAGLSTALGAFLAGLLLSTSEFRHQIEADIEPFKGLLLGLFFVTIGMSVDPAILIEHAIAIAGGLAVLMAVKCAVMFGLGVAFGRGKAVAAESAFLLAHAGEFTLVIAAAGAASGLLPEALAQVLVAVTVLGMALVPLMDIAGRRLAAWIEGRGHALPVNAADRDGQIIIGGFGRVGRTIAEVLETENMPWLALDTDPVAVAAARREGLPVFFGDSSRKDVLLRAGANRAPAFIVTVSNPQMAERMVRAVKAEWPQALIFARAKDWPHAGHLRKLGVNEVVPEAVEGSYALAGQVLSGLGLPAGEISSRIAAQRLKETAAHAHDPL